MTSRVVLHIGAPKTGTTYLQDVLFRNRARLADAGVLYPGDRPGSHFAAVLDLRGMSFGGYDDPDVEGAWEAVVGEARSWQGEAVVISHELLGAADAETITRALTSLDGREVHVVMTARDLGRQVPAVWQEMVKNRQTVDYSTYLSHLTRRKRRGRSAKVFWRHQDIAAVLGQWSAFVPSERIHLVTVPPAGSSPSVLWERFCQVIGVDPTGYETTVPRTNASLGLAEAELLRRVNGVLGQRLSWPQYAATVKFGFAQQLLSPRRDSTRAQVPDRLRPWFDEASAAMVAGVRGRGYDIVGDLEELRPAYGGAEVSEAPEPDEVVAAAAHALAEMLAERAQDRPAGAAGVVQDVSERLRGHPRRTVLGMLPGRVRNRLRRVRHH